MNCNKSNVNLYNCYSENLVNDKLAVYKNIIYIITSLKIHGKKTAFNLILRS